VRLIVLINALTVSSTCLVLLNVKRVVDWVFRWIIAILFDGGSEHKWREHNLVLTDIALKKYLLGLDLELLRAMMV